MADDSESLQVWRRGLLLRRREPVGHGVRLWTALPGRLCMQQSRLNPRLHRFSSSQSVRQVLKPCDTPFEGSVAGTLTLHLPRTATGNFHKVATSLIDKLPHADAVRTFILQQVSLHAMFFASHLFSSLLCLSSTHTHMSIACGFRCH